ncbi:MAG: elongation factor P maturation arginine rhamnosyltransferase EarP [Treponema sp.]|nr:elongation factor P maturation arginine rhamnosyltransferase EarP [Treponema sp.]
MYITVLCRVVDNYGDIGFAWRLCRRLAKIQSQYKICLVLDDFEAFEKIVIASEARQSQIIEGIEIFKWQDNQYCHRIFSDNDGERLQIILELFQCGRPDWMERILFEEKLKRTVHIIMIDYLTAEKYAEDFHCLKSLTRSARVQKVNFMPGFTEHTGGLIIDEDWEQLPAYKADGDILLFTYENDWKWLAAALKACAGERKVLLAQGRGKKSMITALRQAQETKIIELPYLNQSAWDKMMKACSLLIVRGEESMSRACLSGIPFIWQAYPQTEEYQLVKVKALLERMRPHFSPKDFELVEKAWIMINGEGPFDKLRDHKLKLRDHESVESLSNEVGSLSNEVGSLSLSKGSYEEFFSNLKSLRTGFLSFAQSLRKNGDLCTNLMTFINNIDIIDK